MAQAPFIEPSLNIFRSPVHAVAWEMQSAHPYDSLERLVRVGEPDRIDVLINLRGSVETVVDVCVSMIGIEVVPDGGHELFRGSQDDSSVVLTLTQKVSCQLEIPIRSIPIRVGTPLIFLVEQRQLPKYSCTEVEEVLSVFACRNSEAVSFINTDDHVLPSTPVSELSPTLELEQGWEQFLASVNGVDNVGPTIVAGNTTRKLVFDERFMSTLEFTGASDRFFSRAPVEDLYVGHAILVLLVLPSNQSDFA